MCCGAPYSCAVVRGQGGFALSVHRPLKAASPSPFIDPCQGDSNHYLRFNGRRYIPISNHILQCEDVSYPSEKERFQPHIAVSQKRKTLNDERFLA